jgi:hypothetical protein
MSMQTTNHILMVRPTHFQSNPDTAGSNTFQHSDLDAEEAQNAAVAEFDEYVALLREAGVDVMVIQDRSQPHTPDSIFPNNWITTHDDGTVILYPMEALNRRLERRRDILECIGEKFDITSLMDFSSYESKEFFLEGTGSMVLDRVNRIAYVCRSSRSHEMVEDAFAKVMQYRTVWFTSVDKSNMPIYHTNVMMHVGSTLAVVCLESILSPYERRAVEKTLIDTGKVILDISLDQVEHFAGNCIELLGFRNKALLALSRQAWASLTEEQQALVQQHVTPVQAPVETIERLGGGGARCMVAEIHLKLRNPSQALVLDDEAHLRHDDSPYIS